METKQHYIREHMKAAGIGIVELAKRLGQTRQNVYIQIDKSSITLQTLHRIAAALDIEAYKLLLPPDDTRQHDTRQEATEQGTEQGTAAHRQEETRPGIYTRCICPHCHTVLRLMADEWRQQPDDTRKDTQKTAGELQGRAHRRPDGTSHGDGDTTGDTRQPRNTQQAGGAEDKQRGRQKKKDMIYLRERGEKNTDETRKSVHVCAYTFYQIS